MAAATASDGPIREALAAAARCFDGASNHVTARHLDVLFAHLISNNGGCDTDTGPEDVRSIDEVMALAAHVGVEVLRCDPSQRRQCLSEE